MADELAERIRVARAELDALVAEADERIAEVEATLTDTEYVAACVVKFLDTVAASPNREKFESEFRAGNVGMAIFANGGRVVGIADVPDDSTNDFATGQYL